MVCVDPLTAVPGPPSRSFSKPRSLPSAYTLVASYSSQSKMAGGVRAMAQWLRIQLQWLGLLQRFRSDPRPKRWVKESVIAAAVA